MITQTTPTPRRALITGGASVAIGDLHAGRLQEAVQTLDAGDRLLALALDVTAPDSVRAAVSACETAFGGLDTLVNSAGVIRITALDDISEQEWDWVVGVDLKGVFLCSQAAAPLLRQSGRGRIVNLSSDAGKVGFPNIAPYVAAKHGVIGLTKSLAAELAPFKVTVNCICPVGTPETTMGQDVLRMKVRSAGVSAEQLMAATATNVPLGRSGTVEDVVHAVMFLLSDEAAFLTGGTIDVDGGLINTVPIRGTAG